ncbi:sensor histidine kinase [Clostridium botulinum]|uniref:histidine kinase n=3 Tax=Clostridium botulinum TaxID=1491 RepID=A0A9Q1ZCE3_CLOBO|nr:HAMP domain-containing sensor histidine kinase [Clostridium botulinum]AEB75155.1 two-component sensor histidine kinase [Clostridium botulinum BKT015925]KEI00504.1 histidine kinase [Clostridium botulinum C/D str. Sp77]KEI01899.1 histidine kinase [Clostridium botulinum D str. 16868]KLU74858.1 histidine kinase [Clostridium botulinum V891]KOA77175.1 histidine kinase [Clostridium botulinum]
MNIKLNLKRKIILTNIIILAPIIIFIYFITVNTLSKNIINNSVDYLLNENKSAQIYIQNILNLKKVNDVEDALKDIAPFIVTNLSEKFNLRVQMFNTSGQLIYDSAKNQISLYNGDINKALENKKAYVIKKIDGVPYIFLSSPISYKNKLCGTLRFILKESDSLKIVNNTFLIMLICGIFALIIGIILINSFAKQIVNPLTTLEHHSNKIAKGYFKEKIIIDSGDEIEDLANTFNYMSKSLETYICELKSSKENQKKFFDNISHEFKTPLTAIIGFSEILPKLDDKNKILQSSMLIQKEGKRLLTLVEEILQLSKFNQNQFKIEYTYINIKAIIEEVLDIFQIKLDKYHICIDKNYDALFIYGDYNKTKQILINILDNSIKYSGCENIIIRSNLYKGKVEVSIYDDGVGFDINNPKSKTGNGFGLNICKEIMKNQNGEFKIESTYDLGTKITLTFFNNEN